MKDKKPMTVKTLIRQLQRLPAKYQNKQVVMMNGEWSDEGMLARVLIQKKRGPTQGFNENVVYLAPNMME